MPRNFTDFNKDRNSTEKTSSNQIKTTDINILLNRVRLDRKKKFKKKIFFSFFVVSFICITTIFLII